MQENWKDVPLFEGKYEVSNTGKVRGWFYGGKKRKSPKEKTPQKNKNGYMYVVLQNGQLTKAYTIHRLVLSVFDKPQPSNIDCCHKDHNKEHNWFDNLEWGTRKHNENEKRLAGRMAIGEINGASKMTNEQVLLIREMFKNGQSTNSIAINLGLKQQNVWCICNNKTWKHI